MTCSMRNGEQGREGLQTTGDRMDLWRNIIHWVCWWVRVVQRTHTHTHTHTHTRTHARTHARTHTHDWQIIQITYSLLMPSSLLLFFLLLLLLLLLLLPLPPPSLHYLNTLLCLVSLTIPQVESKQTDLLTHPLVTSLLNYKWVHYGQYLYLANICLYLLFLAFITTFAVFAPAPNSRICERKIILVMNCL